MTFLAEPETTPRVQQLYDADRATYGYVMGLSTLWAHQPDAHDTLFGLMRQVADAGGLTLREKGILVAACAATLGDSCCSLAWGTKLAAEADPAVAAGVLTGTDEGLSAAERVLATWARAVTDDPGATTAADVEELRRHGYDDAKVFACTTFVALRLAFSTVNDALGAEPDDELRAGAPAEVRDVVTWGR